MLSRVQSPLNPLNPNNNNKQKGLITEPSQYLQQLQLLLSEKQKKLSETAKQMQKTVEKLESNVELTKQKLSTLEFAKKTLEQELDKNNALLQKAQDSTKIDELNTKNNELIQEKEKIEQEMSLKLTQINELEISLEKKEKEWNNNKKELIQKIKQFENQELMPYLNQIEYIMQLTNSKIEASNTKLTKIMSGEMDFGSNDPFVIIGNKFNEKIINKNELFNGNYFGNNHDDEEEDEDDEEEHKQMNYGNEEDIEVEEIDEIDEINDSDSDEEMEFGSEPDEESSDED
jgi:hypothetical protein